MTLALGTFTPTSITVVDTSTSASPLRNFSSTASLSAAFMRPCTSSMRRSGRSRVRRFSYTTSAGSASTASDSSTSGQTTYTCRPLCTSLRRKPYMPCRLSSGTMRVLTPLRPGGSSSMMEMSRSP